MTNAEPAVRKPTAKEPAEEALEGTAQLRTELTEIRDRLREGIPINDASMIDPRVKELDGEFSEFVDFVNKQLGELTAKLEGVSKLDGVVALDPDPGGVLKALEKKTAESFARMSTIVDQHNKAATKAIEELREQMPSIADLVSVVGELSDKVRLFDEAGVAPASTEDVSSVHGQVNEAHRRINAVAERVEQLGKYLDSPSFGAIERMADVMATARDGLVLGAAPMSGVPAIYGQVHQLMKLVTELGKDKTADKKMGGYQFRSIDAAMDAVGRALREVGVMFQPREIVDRRIERYEVVSKDGYRQNWTHVWVTQRYVFVSLVDGSEMAAVEMDGEARDNGDKSTSKADSMRLKYALLQALMIPVNGLPESDGRDGTEGGTTYGRGDAGESWENATPARQTQQAGHEQHVDSRRHTAPEEVGNSETASAPPVDDRSPEEKATAAQNALIALAGFAKEEQRPRLDKILRAITTAGIGETVIQHADGRQTTLNQYAATVNAQVGV